MAQVWRDIREEAVLDFYAVVKGSPINLLIINIDNGRKRNAMGMIFWNFYQVISTKEKKHMGRRDASASRLLKTFI